MSGVGTDAENRQGRRDDITLLVRKFNFTLTHALASPTVRFNPTVNTIPAWANSQSDPGSSFKLKNMSTSLFFMKIKLRNKMSMY